jgi:hypothetical protein
MTQIRLIAIDIDGTLLDSRWLVPESNRRAIAEATARGIEVALVTGRRFDFARAVIDQIPSPLTLIVNNGALVKTKDGTTVIRHLLPREIARQVLEATQAFRDGTGLIFDRPCAEQVVIECLEPDEPHMRRYLERNRDFVVPIAPLQAALTEDPIQIMYSGPVQPMRQLVAILAGLPIADRYAFSVTEYEDRDFTLVDVVRAGCSKGAMLAEWTVRRGLAREEVMAIGDNLNDREMLEFAGLRVVMGNCAPPLRALGWPTTLTNDEGGVAAAIEKFVLHADQDWPSATRN